MMACKRHTPNCVVVLDFFFVVVVVVFVVFVVCVAFVVFVVPRRMSLLGQEAVTVGAAGCFFPRSLWPDATRV